MGVNRAWSVRLPSNNPCKKECPRRSATCHAECADYAAYVETRKAESAQRVERLQSTPMPRNYNGNRLK